MREFQTFYGGRMYKFIFKRLFMLIPVIIGVTFLVFFILSFSPGDPVSIMLGVEATEEAILAVREELGLDDPVLVQYANYMFKLVQGDMGESYAKGRDVATEIVNAFPPTLVLTFWGMLVSIIIAIPIGIISATKQYTIIDNVCMVVALLGVSMPSFWLGLLLILGFSLHLGWFPSGGIGSWKSYVLPSISLGASSAAITTRMTRSSMLDVIRQDYIRTARAKGVDNGTIIRKHALRNALIPVVTIIGMQIGSMLGGAVLTETVFSIPGIGRLLVDGIKTKDTPMILGCLIATTICFSVINLGVDILYGYIDPRIKAEYK